MKPAQPPLVVIITGVTGSGKTTVGQALAGRLGWDFQDADDLHSVESVERMRRGQPLNDELRRPWLDRVRGRIENAVRDNRPAVVACSALKADYRERLAGGLPGVAFVLLTAPADILRARVARRTGHFAGPELVDSQLETLEPPANALTVDVRPTVDEIVTTICTSLHLPCS